MITTRLTYYMYCLYTCIPPFFGLRVQFTPGRRQKKLIMRRNFYQRKRSTKHPSTALKLHKLVMDWKKQQLWAHPFCQAKRILPNMPVPSAGENISLQAALTPCNNNVDAWCILLDHLSAARWLWLQLLWPRGFQHRHLWERPEWLKSLTESWRKPEREGGGWMESFNLMWHRWAQQFRCVVYCTCTVSQNWYCR